MYDAFPRPRLMATTIASSLAATIPWPCSSALAQQSEPEYGDVATANDASSREEAKVLQKVVVVGTRDPNVPLSNVPASISVVSRDQIKTEQATAQRIEDILTRTVPGFNPTNSGVRQIRGRTAQVFVNGVPVNEQLVAGYGNDINLLAPGALDTVEVSRGANSAYGFGSPGGIIAMTTPRAASETLKLESQLGTSFNTSDSSGTFQTDIRQSAGQIVGNFDYYVGATVRQDGLVRDPDGRPALDFASPAMFSMGKEDLYNFDTSLGYSFDRGGSVHMAVTVGRVEVDENWENDFSGTYRGTQANIARSTAGDGNYRRHHTVNVTYENEDLGGNAIKLELLSSRARTVKFSDSGTFLIRDEASNEYQGLRSSMTTPLDGWHDGASLTYGFDALRNEFFNPRINDSSGQVTLYFSPRATLDSYAPYVQGQVPLGNWRLSAGVRHERYRGEIDTATDSVTGIGNIQGGDIQSFNLSLFNAGVVYALDEAAELYASFTQGAEISQLGRAAQVAGTADRVDPQPAKSDQYEVGMRHRHKAFDYTLAAFYTTSDLMSALDCSLPAPEPCKPLREPREFWGVEGTLGWQPHQQWNLGGTLSWMNGNRTLPTGEERRTDSATTPPLLLGAYVQFSPLDGWTNRIQFDYRGSRDPFGDSMAWPEGPVDSLFLAHLSSRFKLGKGQLQLGVRNLFDKKYFSIAAEAYNGGWMWIPDQGRRVSVSYSASW